MWGDKNACCCVANLTWHCTCICFDCRRIAIEESNLESYFAIANLDVLERTVWATLQVAVALSEAGWAVWDLKRKFMAARPITGIQCRLGYNSNNARRVGTAWKGPYMGVGRRDLSTWQPYQEINFVTPPFPGYISGHSTFSGAAAEVGLFALTLAANLLSSEGAQVMHVFMC